jgi:hypothetical protein
MSDPYRDAEASLTENLEQRRAELDAIDQTLVPLHERREEVLTEIDLLTARIGALRSVQRGPASHGGRSAMVGFGVFVMAAFSMAYGWRGSHCTSSRSSVARQETRAIQALAEVSLQDMQKTDKTATCPRVEDVFGSTRGKPVRDPWRNPYRLECNEGEIHVTSNGPDGIAGTRDDIRDGIDPTPLQARVH